MTMKSTRKLIGVFALLLLAGCKSGETAQPSVLPTSVELPVQISVPSPICRDVDSPVQYLCVHLSNMTVTECLELWAALRASDPRRYVTPGPDNVAPTAWPVLYLAESGDPKVVVIVYSIGYLADAEGIRKLFQKLDGSRSPISTHPNIPAD